MELNITKPGDNVETPQTSYYIAKYKKYIDTHIPDEVFEKKEINLPDDKNTNDELKIQIGLLVNFNLENKEEIHQGELGNYYIQQKLINE